MGGGLGRVRRSFALLAACAALTGTGVASALTVVNGRVVSEDDPAQGNIGFTVPKEDSKTLDKLDDFHRYVDKKAWELAFRTMNSLQGETGTGGSGMVPVGDGFMMPLRRKITQSLVEMPAEGREAYRLFYDAEAKKLWEQVKEGKETGAAELRNLQRITSQFFLTSVGDVAADRMGDLLFERGDFGGAEAAWAMVVRDYPETKVDVGKVQVKRCVALARLLRHEDLAAVAGTVKEQYRDAKVTIGGEEVAAGAFVDGLLKQTGGAAAATEPAPEEAAIGAADFSEAEVAWQIRVAPGGTLEKMDQQIQQQGWGYRGWQFAGMLPGAATDGKRLYVNWVGVIYAADLETGKMLWRTGKFSEIPQKAIQFIQYGVDASKMTVGASGGKVFGVLVDLQRGDRGQLHCFDGATGKVLWKGERLGQSLSMPTVIDGKGYCVAGTNGDAQLVKFDPDTGAAEWKVPLGKFQIASNPYSGMQEVPEVGILVTTGMVYVATNNGALLAVNTAQRRLEWAFKHEGRVASMGYNDWGQPVHNFEAGLTMLMDSGLLYLKDSSGRMMYTIDPMGPALKWKRPLNAEEMVVGIEGDRAYVMGRELSAMDLKTRRLLWSTKLPVVSGGVRPMLAKGHLYVPTGRGIYDIDPANGDVLKIHRGADRESMGGRMIVIGDRVVCVGDVCVTAYRMGESTKHETQDTKR
jgi:outer membrane protein assembly factor BamB